MNPLKKFLTVHFPWLLLMIAVTIESSFSNIPAPDLGISFSDKIYHFIVYGILGWFLARGFHLSNTDFLKKHAFLLAVIVGALFGLSDEWHQSMVPGRDSEFLDWVADCLGIIIFAWSYHHLFRLNKFPLFRRTKSTN